MIDQATLKSLMEYDPLTGLWRWVRPNSGRAKKGWFRGSKSSTGYLVIQVNKKLYGAHRLAWLYVHGSLPEEHIDHINCDKEDNRIDNLRTATHAENLWNRRHTVRSSTGVKGVFKNKRGYRAEIQANKRRYFVGYFSSVEDAMVAIENASSAIHGRYGRI